MAGTESILTAVKTSRDYMRARKGIRHPEMVVGQSAHAAFFKAAEYFKVKLVVVGCLSLMLFMQEHSRPLQFTDMPQAASAMHNELDCVRDF